MFLETAACTAPCTTLCTILCAASCNASCAAACIASCMASCTALCTPKCTMNAAADCPCCNCADDCAMVALMIAEASYANGYLPSILFQEPPNGGGGLTALSQPPYPSPSSHLCGPISEGDSHDLTESGASGDELSRLALLLLGRISCSLAITSMAAKGITRVPNHAQLPGTATGVNWQLAGVCGCPNN